MRIHTAHLPVGKPCAMRISKGLQRQTLAAYAQDAGILCRCGEKDMVVIKKGGFRVLLVFFKQHGDGNGSVLAVSCHFRIHPVFRVHNCDQPPLGKNPFGNGWPFAIPRTENSSLNLYMFFVWGDDAGCPSQLATAK